MTLFTDKFGNPYPQLIPWHRRAYECFRRHYIAFAAIAATIATLITNVEKISKLFPGSARLAKAKDVETQRQIDKLNSLIDKLNSIEGASSDDEFASSTSLLKLANEFDEFSKAKRRIVASELEKHTDLSHSNIRDLFDREITVLDATAKPNSDNRQTAIASIEEGCRASRAAFFLLITAIESHHPESELMATQLEEAHERAIPVLANCPCEFCSAVVASIRRRHRYLAVLRRGKTTHELSDQMRWLAHEL